MKNRRNPGRRRQSCPKTYDARQKKTLNSQRKAGLIILGVVLLGILLLKGILPYLTSLDAYREIADEDLQAEKPEIDVQLLTVNPYSRPGIETDRIRGIVIHYTANPGATAQQNRDYFESLKDTGKTSVSSNFIVGLDGEIIQCVPTWEVAYASNDRNNDTVSIECCHPDETGAFQKETYVSMVQLTAWLCEKFGLTSEDVVRHYDVTGKNCPKYFVENEEEWIKFKENVQKAIENTENNRAES